MFIQFESGKAKEAERQAIKNARETILAEAEERYHRKEAQAERAKQRGDDKWMLPSVEEKLASSDKSKKKKKKGKEKKSKKSKKKKHKKSSSSSSSSSSDEDKQVEWVEKSSEAKKDSASSSAAEPAKPLQRDEWMNLSGSFLCSSREKKTKNDEGNKQDTCILDKPGQSSRELNPYWRNGGTGLPEAAVSSKSSSTAVSAEWLKKSLQRAQEQSRNEGKSLEEIAKERWGSLDTIKSMIAEAEQNSRPSESRGWSNDKQNYKDHRRDYKRSRDRSRSRSRSRDQSRRNNDKRSFDYDDKKKLTFRRPREDDQYTSSSRKTDSTVKSWRKPEANKKINQEELKSPKPSSSKFSLSQEIASSASDSEPEEPSPPAPPKILSDDELNKLGARIVKAEIMGNNELAEQLKEELKNAREAKKNNPNAKAQTSSEENVILTSTNSRGMARPLQRRSHYEEPQGGRRKNKKVNAYEDGQRVRYFADDDKYSLQDMFQREKGQSSADDDKAFVKMASKNMDMDELFEERITHGESDAKQDLKDKMRAIHEHKKMEKSLENCRWCVGSREMQKHLIVAMESKIYLSLPAHVSLTTGHCILAPIHHCSSQTLLDEDVWEELKIFKTALTKMFTEKNEYPIFFEIFMGRQRFPHMYLQCVPLPEEVGSMAPMYFKKALLECEMEWSTNKKVVDLSQKDVRQAIPKGLPYFAVDFGGKGGFAHVIEDEQLFPRNFAQEVIGGMLDLDSNMWRKPRREKFEVQKNKVLAFAKIWKNYEPTSSND